MIDLLGFWFNVSLLTVVPMVMLAIYLMEPAWHLLNKASEGRYDCVKIREFYRWVWMTDEYRGRGELFPTGYANKWDDYFGRCITIVLSSLAGILMIVVSVVHNIAYLQGSSIMWGIHYKSASAMTVGWVSTIAEAASPFTGWVALALMSTVGVYGLLKLGFRMYYSVADKLAALEK